MSRSIFLSILFLSLTATGCFNPDLGDQPFRCAQTGKACPDDYTCQDRGGVQVCIANDKLNVLGDGGPGTDAVPTKDSQVFLDGAIVKPATGCSAVDSEPNNTTSTATPLSGQQGLVPGWEICYPGDVDNFSVNLQAGQNISVKLKFSHANGDLDMVLVDPGNFQIRESRSEDNDEEIQTNVAVAGTYFIHVFGFNRAVNTYDIELIVQ